MWLSAIILFAAAVSATRASRRNSASANPERHIVCDGATQGLLREDCEYMCSLGISEMGINDLSDNGKIWIGNDGPNKLTFTNRADTPVTVVIWHQIDFKSSFVRAQQPYVTYSLPKTGDSVVISVGNCISGGFAALYERITTLNPYGQVYNTWGEFTSGPFATINVSREPNMEGNGMNIRTGGGCASNMDTCVFKCYNSNSCWQDNTYYLQKCEAGSQTGNPHIGYDDNNQPQGGCGGWENGGLVQIDFLN